MKLSIAAAIALLTMSTTVNGKDLCFASVLHLNNCRLGRQILSYILH